VVYLVSSSVPGMSADDVTVTDSNGNVLNAPGQGVTSATSTTTQADATQAEDSRLETQLQSMLTAALGPGNAQVAVNAVLDFDSTNTQSKSYVYDKDDPPVSQSQTQETYTGTGTIPSGTLGATDTTTGGTTGTTGTTTTSGGNGTYNQTTNTVNNALGTQTVTTTSAPGQVKQLAIGVLLNQSAKNVNAAQIESMIKGAVGFDSTRGDTISVNAMPFNTAQQQAATAANKLAVKAAAATASQTKLISLAKQGLLGVLILVLVVGAWLASRKRAKNRDPDWNDRPGSERSGFRDEDDLPSGPSPLNVVPAPDLTDLASRRRDLVAVANNRPKDVAEALSGWLSTTREN
jgi:flagellar M-ring protein FliF